MKRKISLLYCLLPFALFASGCATYKKAEPYPADAPKSAVTIDKDTHPSTANMIVGTYYDAEHRVAVTGHQRGDVVGGMFGVVGVLVADAVDKSVGAHKFSNTLQKFPTNLTEQTRDALAAAIQSEGTDRIIATSDSQDTEACLNVIPLVVMQIVGNNSAHAFVELRVTLTDKKNAVLWETWLHASAPGMFYRNQNEDWDPENHLQEAIKTAIDNAAWTLVQDVEGKLNGTRTVYVKGPFCWQPTAIKYKALVVAETEDLIVLRMMTPDGFAFSGIQTLNKSEAVIEDADFTPPTQK